MFVISFTFDIAIEFYRSFDIIFMLSGNLPTFWSFKAANFKATSKHFSKDLCFQGNLDPMLLVVGGNIMKKEVLKILANMQDRKFIFNLGHGILPQTPIKNVHELINIIKSY